MTDVNKISVVAAYLYLHITQSFLLVRSHQVELIRIIVKGLIHGPNNVTRVGVEPRSCKQGCRKNNTLPPRPHIYSIVILKKGSLLKNTKR